MKNNSKTRRAERRARAEARQAEFNKLTLQQKYERANPGSREEWRYAIQLDKEAENA